MSCDSIETFEHQLFDCQNAQRLWDLYNSCFHTNKVTSLKEAISCMEYSFAELTKGLIFKLLIQIDRSMHLSIKDIINKLLSMIMVEIICCKNRYNEEEINKVKQILQSKLAVVNQPHCPS